MNRVIKFRAWDKRKNEWMHAFKTMGGFSLFGETIVLGGWLTGVNLKDWDEIVVTQFTGLKDKNDKDIYEGDIVSVYDKENLFEVCFGTIERKVVGYNDNSIYEVEINRLEFNGFYFRSIKDGKAYLSIVNNKFGEHDLKGTEIVGNIFENGDLLK